MLYSTLSRSVPWSMTSNNKSLKSYATVAIVSSRSHTRNGVWGEVFKTHTLNHMLNANPLGDGTIHLPVNISHDAREGLAHKPLEKNTPSELMDNVLMIALCSSKLKTKAPLRDFHF
jgi:hypothetical protein